MPDTDVFVAPVSADASAKPEARERAGAADASPASAVARSREPYAVISVPGAPATAGPKPSASESQEA